jgi:hypothetical protein
MRKEKLEIRVAFFGSFFGFAKNEYLPPKYCAVKFNQIQTNSTKKT